MAFFSDNFAFKTIIGYGSSIVGDLLITGSARIDGDLDGSLESNANLIIGDTARINANINAKSVTIIGGVVQGNIIAPESVKLHSSAIILGDIITSHLYMESNVILQGKCVSLKNEVEFEEAKNLWLNTNAIQEVKKRKL
ncbi:MAG: bactofilin family protein [Treponemataceae bacterium]